MVLSGNFRPTKTSEASLQKHKSNTDIPSPEPLGKTLKYLEKPKNTIEKTLEKP